MGGSIGYGMGTDSTARSTHGMIRGVRDLLGRAAIGIGLAATIVMAIGYAYVFNAIGTPPADDLAALDVPADGTAVPALLADRLPAYVASVEGEVVVLDARAPRAANAAAVLLAWCASEQAFVDPIGKRAFNARGEPLSGEGPGLTVFDTRTSEDDARVIVGPTTRTSAGAPITGREVECAAEKLTAHAPDADDIFDPSVALDQEPPGWIWLEGTLLAANGEVRLCDGLGGACADWAVASGIDPATVQETRGRFIGRVRDGAIAGIIIVPDLGGSS